MANEKKSLDIAVRFIKSRESLASASPNSKVLLDDSVPGNTKVYAHWDSIGKVWTIGWGNVFYPNGTQVKQGDVITKSQADSYVEQVAAQKMAEIKKTIDISNLNDNQLATLVSVAYNAGIGNLKKTSILPAIRANKPASEVANIISDSLVTSKGVFVQGLKNRRVLEASLYLSPAGGSVLNLKTDKILLIGIVLLAAGISTYLYFKFKKK